MPNPTQVCATCTYAEARKRPYLGPDSCTEYLWCHLWYKEVNPRSHCYMWRPDCADVQPGPKGRLIEVKRRRSPDGARMFHIRIGKLNFSVWWMFDVELWRSDSRQVDVSEMSGNDASDVIE